MAQLSLYIDDKLLKKITQVARKKKMSLSQWVKSHLEVLVNDSWSPEYFSVFGSLSDVTLERPPHLDFKDDHKREAL